MIDASPIHASDPHQIAAALGLEVARGSSHASPRVPCPLCAGSRSTCAIASPTGRIVWHCHRCHAGGNAIALAAACWGLSDRDWRETARRLASALGVTIETDRPSPPRPRPEFVVDIATAIDSAASDWIAGRDVRPSDAAAIGRATRSEYVEAMADLERATADARELDAVRSDELERLAIAHAAAHPGPWAEGWGTGTDGGDSWRSAGIVGAIPPDQVECVWREHFGS